jgi:hypothetical protein
MSMTVPSINGTTSSEATVISQLMESIMTNTPTTVIAEVTICVRLWLSVWLTASTSLVIRDKTSPCVVLSK